MKKLFILIFTFILFGSISAQVEYEKVGSLYNFWDDIDGYDVIGDHIVTAHDGMIEIYQINSNSTLESIVKITDHMYEQKTKLLGNYLFASYRMNNQGVSETHYVAFDVTDLTNPQKIKDIVATDNDLNIVSAVVNGTYAYSANLKVWDVTDILNPTLLSSTLEPLVDPSGALTAKPFDMENGYLIYELFFYSSFNNSRAWKYYKIDVSNPMNPINLGLISKPNPEQSINDTLTYSLGNEYSTNFLIKIYNNSDPDNPVEISSISGNLNEFATRSYFAKIGNYIYARVNGFSNSTELDKGDLYIINVADPYNPILETVYHTQTNYANSEGTAIIGNKVYAASLKAQFAIFDFTDPVNPVEVMTELSDDPYGYPISKVKIQGNYAYLHTQAKYINPYNNPVDEYRAASATRIIDISDPANMTEVAIIDSLSLLDVEGDYVYGLSANYSDYGFFIYNISDPQNPYQESFFPRSKAIIDFKIHNGYAYLVLNGISYFYVVDVRDASNPTLVNIFGYGYSGFTFDGNILYDKGGDRKWDITDPSNPVLLGTSSDGLAGGYLGQIEFFDNKILTFNYDGMRVYDVSNFPVIPQIGRYQFPYQDTGSPGNHAIHDIYAFVPFAAEGIMVLNFNEENNTTLDATIAVPGFSNYDVEFSNGYIYTANQHSFDVYMLQLPAPPEAFTLISPESIIETTDTNLLWHSTSDPNGPTVNFDVYLATKSDFSDQYKVVEGITDTTFSVSDLQVGQTYYWKVHATDDNTSGTWSSNNLSFTIFSPEVTVKFENNIGGETKGGVTVLDENVIYVPSSSKVVRFNGDGSIEYTLNVNGIIKSSSTITSDHTVYIASTDNNLYSFNSNGVTNPNWPVALGAEATASVAVGPNDNLYIGTSNGIYQAISRNGNILWSYNVGAAVYSSSVISSTGILYVINKNGRLYAFDLDTLDPSNVQYKWKLELGEAISSSPALDISNNLYVTTELGKLIKVNDNGTSGAVGWTYNSNGNCESSPVIDGALNIYFSGKGGKVFSVNGTTGNLNWEVETHYSHSNPDAILKASPTLSADGNRIYVGDTFGTVYGISTITGKIVWSKLGTGLIEGPILAANNTIFLCTEGVVTALNEPNSGLLKNTKRITLEGNPMWPTFQGNAQRTGYNGENVVIEYNNILALRENDDAGIPILKDSIKTITGTITASNCFGANGPAFIMDSEAGVSLYDSDFIDQISLGDSITVTGKVGFYSGLTQLRWDAAASAVIVHKNIPNPEPKIVDIANVLNQSWNWMELIEGNLIRINNVEFETTGNFEANTNYFFTDGINSLSVRIDNDVNVVSTSIPIGEVDLVGCLGQFKSGAPYNAGYQIFLRNIDDIKLTTGVEEKVEVPTTYSLSQNYPNPFNPSTIIQYGIPQNGRVTLKVYNILGTEISTLINQNQPAGIHTVSFDASKLGSGVYFYTIRAGEFFASKKMLLIK